jgi:hypothetical protein
VPASPGPRRRRARRTDEARLVERFKRLAPQQKALRLALRPFSDANGHFDRQLWEQAFTSQEPERIVEVKAVTALFEGLVNHLVEMLRVAASLRGLDVVAGDERPTGPELFIAVGDDGGLTPNNVTVLKRLYAMRNKLQHASPGVDAGDVYDDVVLLDKTLAGFVKSCLAWLRQHGISLL